MLNPAASLFTRAPGVVTPSHSLDSSRESCSKRERERYSGVAANRENFGTSPGRGLMGSVSWLLACTASQESVLLLLRDQGGSHVVAALAAAWFLRDMIL
ncbi:hypothetical protein M758_2G030800 [Ceratodon purpureus]|nr:hypothetical protein M758_2G030800 [Ceratodon purpureus]